MWGRFVVASAGALGFMTTVCAGVLGQKAEALVSPPAHHVNWAGFYIGANGGYGWSARHPQVVDAATNDTGQLGVTGGVGLTLTPNWSLKVEYQFIRLEGLSAFETFAVSGATHAVRTFDPGHDYHTVMAGLDYQLKADYRVLK